MSWKVDIVDEVDLVDVDIGENHVPARPLTTTFCKLTTTSTLFKLFHSFQNPHFH